MLLLDRVDETTILKKTFNFDLISCLHLKRWNKRTHNNESKKFGIYLLTGQWTLRSGMTKTRSPSVLYSETEWTLWNLKPLLFDFGCWHRDCANNFNPNNICTRSCLQQTFSFPKKIVCQKFLRRFSTIITATCLFSLEFHNLIEEMWLL